MPEFQLARIETIDVTREIPKGSTEALVRKLRSKWDISFPQAMMWGVLACAAAFAITIVRERKQGTFLRLQVAPVTRAKSWPARRPACFLAVIGVIAIMVALGIVAGHAAAEPGAAGARLGVHRVLLRRHHDADVGDRQNGGSRVGRRVGANMFMAMFGGGMMPLVFMPGFMKTISHFSPVKWSILALEGSIWRGFTLSEMLLPCAVLLAWAPCAWQSARRCCRAPRVEVSASSRLLVNSWRGRLE